MIGLVYFIFLKIRLNFFKNTNRFLKILGSSYLG